MAASVTCVFLLWWAGAFEGPFFAERHTPAFGSGIPEFYEIDHWPWWLVRLLLVLLAPALCGALLITFPRRGRKSGYRTMQRMGASRLGEPSTGGSWRLAPTADGDRSAKKAWTPGN
jgi:hypothetical protein